MTRRVLLDECVPRRLGPHLAPHVCSTVTKQGWNGIQNGEVLRLAEQHFDVLLTVDKALPAQQQIASLQIAVVVIRAPANKLSVLLPLVQKIRDAIENAKAGTVVTVTA